jgi:uncharacterized protein GlcG (DUF336 family)
MEEVSLPMALKMLEVAEEKINTIYFMPSAMAVVGKGGHLIAAYRMDLCLMRPSILVAQNKARSAAIWSIATKTLDWLISPLGGAHTLEIAMQHEPPITSIMGGVPITNEAGAEVIGGTGSSGGTGECDLGTAKTMAMLMWEEEISLEFPDEVVDSKLLYSYPWRSGLGLAKKMLIKAINYSRGKEVYSSIAIVDDSGWLVAFGRDEKATIGSIDIAINKAWTASAFRVPTSDLSRWGNPGVPGYGINTENFNSKLTTISGGLPIVVNGDVIGGIGTSCGSIKDDIAISEAGISAIA